MPSRGKPKKQIFPVVGISIFGSHAWQIEATTVFTTTTAAEDKMIIIMYDATVNFLVKEDNIDFQ